MILILLSLKCNNMKLLSYLISNRKMFPIPYCTVTPDGRGANAYNSLLTSCVQKFLLGLLSFLVINDSIYNGNI